MTRDEMIGEIISAWGVSAERGLDELNYLLNTPSAWSETWLRQEDVETVKRQAWPENASVEWLPILQDIIDNPPDLSSLKLRYSKEIEANWPYDDFDEESWLLQIDSMLSLWKKREPEAVNPLLEQVTQQGAKYWTQPVKPRSEWRYYCPGCERNDFTVSEMYWSDKHPLFCLDCQERLRSGLPFNRKPKTETRPG